ncbi:putative ABC transporter [Tothia fuscella]|uniref:ABC transporter n=1 Tax=Tothia fuscella TaxID=1048955 RepID=A0A9P4NHN2_9PEZI|nr:putative ABC transporter [Tothia fuscella]
MLARALQSRYKNILVDQDLPVLSQDMTPDFTRRALLQTWSHRVKPDTKNSLPLALFKCLKKPFFNAIIPRLFLILFRYSQPNLIKESIRYVVTSPAYATKNHGYWLIISAVVIYIGMAISTAIYQHRINRLKLMTKGALIGLIHHKTMKAPSIPYNDGKATTLMSNNTDSLEGIAEMMHKTWAQIIKVLIGFILLAGQVGWVWPLPLFLIYLYSHMSRFVAKHLQPRQKAWNEATQDRIAATTSLLSSMKTVKMLGFQHRLTHHIRDLRKEEIQIASRLKWIMVYYNASANALGIFSPAITLVLYAVISVVRGSTLDIETAFTTTAILSMVTHPANMIITIVPRAVAAFAGFERIQAYLLRRPLRTNRGTLARTNPTPAIRIRQLQIGHELLVLKDIDINVATGSFVVISGPTGSGKSTILRAILGEIMPTHGSIDISTRRVAYCAQKPWLPNGIIREVIYGASNTRGAYDDEYERRYHEGLNLSGGQRQRVTLARALFAKCDILLLDDTFSGLDGKTERIVFNNLFGLKGFVRRSQSSVVLVCNASQYFESADHVVVLGDHGIVDQGNWQNIKIKAGAIAKFASQDHTKEKAVHSVALDKFIAQVRATDEARSDLARQSGDSALYGYYLASVGSTNALLLATCTAAYAFFITAPQYWLQLWTDSDSSHTAFYACGYLVLSFMSWSLTSAQMCAPFSFFSNNDTGSTLNRFSQDVQLIDKHLPSALQTVVTQIFKLIMQIALLCVAERWLAITVPACMLVVYYIQRVYLRTSRQLRYLELESRAEVFSSFMKSIKGLETIRSFGWSKATVQQNILSVDHSQRPEFLLMCAQRWLNVVLDLLAAAIAISVVAIAVGFRKHISGAQVGIALNVMLVANTTLLKLVESWTTLETSLGAIACLKILEQVTPSEERKYRNLVPPEAWPTEGYVEFRNITALYQTNSVTLRGVSLNITAGQRIFICGRTGSGKSILILTLLRLLELQSGKILLDGIDIKQVRLDLLRQRCFVTLSQDVLLLSNETLRFNLDPDALVSNDVLIDALVKVGLWPHFSTANTLPEYDIATSITIPDLGKDPIFDQIVSLFRQLSAGQCQLFAFCRALVKVSLLRHSGVMPVIVLDEVTSSLDITTESIINRVIDDEFVAKGHTIIIVAYRIGAFEERRKSGRDTVVLMTDGRLQEGIEHP